MPLLDAFLRSGLDDSVIDPGASGREVFVALRKDGQTGVGTWDDPFDGSDTKFDQVMANLAQSGYQTIHLGPGTYKTAGSSAIPAWIPLSGQRIIGSGMFETVMQLQLSGSPAERPYAHFLRDAGVLEGYEISDLTFDCNLGGQPNTSGFSYPRIAVGALRLKGRDILIRRVRVINFGTRTPNWECFPISIGIGDDPSVTITNCVIEDSIVEQPALNNARETTCLVLSAGETNLKAGYHEDCVIRNCFINCEYVRTSEAKPALAVKSLSKSGSVATLETFVNHGRVPDDWIVVSGAMVNGGWNNPFNGSFKVASGSGTVLTYSMDVQPGGNPDTTADIWLGKAPSEFVSIKELTWDGTRVTLELSSPHFRCPGDYVLVSNVSGLTPSPNGYYAIDTVDNAKRLTYLWSSSPTGTKDLSVASIGASLQALSGGGSGRWWNGTGCSIAGLDITRTPGIRKA